jgi:hypothetical protein
MPSRRYFIKASGMGLAGMAAVKITPAEIKKSAKNKKTEILFELGIASYTFRKFGLEDTLAMTNRLEIRNIVFKDFHLPLTSTHEEILKTVEKVKQSGINLYGGGVIYMENENAVLHAFDYAKTAGMKMIIGAPEHALLPLVEKKVKEYGIMVAIHNHGPGDQRWPTLGSIYDKIKALDPGIGICHDIGHTQRFGEDPVMDTDKYFDRILDMHLKDVTESSGKGNTCEMGRGVIDIPGVIKVLIKNGYKGKASFEYEKDENDPLPGLAESVGYTRGILKMLHG